MKPILTIQFLIFLAISCLFTNPMHGQELYTARGYWQELNQENYKKILEKRSRGEQVTVQEATYLEDYEAYLARYYERMSDAEKAQFERMKAQWDRAAQVPEDELEENFNLRARDRVVNGFYGLYYGASIVAITESESGGVIVGVPLIMAGLWQLGPAINPKKFENMTLATVRAGNAGKILGLINGGSLGLAIGGDSDNGYKLALGLSSIGSIALGELAFQGQKKKQFSVGHVGMVRHYGFLGPITMGLGYLAFDENANAIGVSLLAGGIGGLLIGNSVAKKYDYTEGDVDVISSLSIITASLGAIVPIEGIESESNRGLLLVPAATYIAGTIFAQRSVKGIKITRRQGSTISLASGGAALIGGGIVALTSSEIVGLYIGAASVSALIAHQVLFSSYKRTNLEKGLQLGKDESNRIRFSARVTPENYLINKKMSETAFLKNPTLTYPIVKLKLTF